MNTRRYKGKRISGEGGAVMIVEAAFVFPIMFFIVFIMLMAGSAYFQQARIERILEEYAIEAAACCENPMLEKIINDGGSIPTDPVRNDTIKPYRYLFQGNTQRVRANMESRINSSINGFGTLGFAGMQARLDGLKLSVKPHCVLVPVMVADCSFHVDLPIRMIFSDQPIRFRFRLTAREPVGDPSEFVRNVSTVQDYAERSEKIMEIAGKIGSALHKLGTYTN